MSPEKEKSGFGRPSIGRGKSKRVGIAFQRFALDLRAAGIGQAEHFGDLVEGFADGIVDRRAEPQIIADAAHRDELGMAARDEQQQIGKIETAGEPRGQRMGFEMVDGDEGFARRQRQRLARRSAR